MDRSGLRKKVLINLVSAPWTLIPTVGGLSMMMLSGMIGHGTEYWLLGGIAGVLAGIGSLATRWIWNADAITKESFEALQAEARQHEEENLNALQGRLQKDHDPRTEELLTSLRSLYKQFREGGGWSAKMDRRTIAEIGPRVETLFRGCVRSLERSLEFWETAQKMATKDARRTILNAREHLLDEIGQSIQQLAKTIDEMQAHAVQGTDQDLGQIRRELDESLAVARRVEERMSALDAELGHTPARAERE